MTRKPYPPKSPAKPHRKGKHRGSAGTPQGAEQGGLPTREQILAFLEQSPERSGKREIARAFGVSGDDRVALKRLLQEMAHDGALVGTKKALKAA